MTGEIAEDVEPPVQRIDVPDPVDRPSGCRFHTRCPFATEVCATEKPELESASGSGSTACFRQFSDHEYWDSPELDPDAARRAREIFGEAEDSSTRSSE
jgi:peptide/nickel transport system ATP-binding protein